MVPKAVGSSPIIRPKFGRLAQLARALRLHRRGRGFEPLSAHHDFCMYYDIKKGLKDTSRLFSLRVIIIMAAVLLLIASYVTFNYFSPRILAKSVDAMQAIDHDVRTIQPIQDEDVLRIPSIGVDVQISDKFMSSHVLREKTSKTIVLSSKRLSVGLTPGETIQKSPLYNLGGLTVGDVIYVDSGGQRFVYEVKKIEERVPTSQLTGDLVVYVYDDSSSGQASVAVIADRLGTVDWIDGEAGLVKD